MTSYRRGPHGSVTDVCHHLELLDVPLTIVQSCTISSSNKFGNIEGEVKYNGKVLATYKYCTGLDFPLFRFQGEWWDVYGQPKVYVPENGKSKVEFRLTLGPHGNPSLYLFGDLATPELHEFAMRFISANHRDDPKYHLRQKAYCFFQGGSHDPKGKFIYIEMYGAASVEVIEYFNNNFTYKVKKEKKK